MNLNYKAFLQLQNYTIYVYDALLIINDNLQKTTIYNPSGLQANKPGHFHITNAQRKWYRIIKLVSITFRLM